MIWTRVAMCAYAGIEIISIPATRRVSKSFCMHFRSQRDAGKLCYAHSSVYCEPALTIFPVEYIQMHMEDKQLI